MIKVSRDRAELGSDPFVWVFVERRNSPSEDQATVCGFCAYRDPEQGYVVSNRLSVEEAFREACDVAKKKGISAIWIEDLDLRFDFKPREKLWLGQCLTDRFDSHS
jgi:hypothetical protein